ncbi:hypothetical protein KTU01_27760 [Kocuria turfanensis]|uniref:Uncharacterized protein n=1 Tax=Kocuria turfanensis TaxID=388357 RepID=A0A512IG23_9MICC|nr:hypothetical protein KTU01_27760 [Kocuria turfanensis]
MLVPAAWAVDAHGERVEELVGGELGQHVGPDGACRGAAGAVAQLVRAGEMAQRQVPFSAP